ncbi:MAG: ABC transporter substrate-binding protein [Acidobacteria bacterium]|nr:ABC transporter substrate-binding protein [Acidobacteriota bacterium]
MAEGPRAAAFLLVAILTAGCGAAEPEAVGVPTGSQRAIIDMRGVEVRVPVPLTRVATVDDGFVESVMTRLGVIETLVAVGSSSQQRTWPYPRHDGSPQSTRPGDGMGTMRALHPWIAGLPCASRGSGAAVNYETIAAARPEVVILRVGDCTLGTSTEVVDRTTAVFQAAGIPVVLLRSPADYRGRGLQTLRDEILVLGRLFGKEVEAAALAGELDEAERQIASRVASVPKPARPRALYLGLSSTARDSGGSAYVWGTGTAESWMLEHVAGARNAFQGAGARVLLNAEQLLALDPDVIFLPTSSGYHPPDELYGAPHYRELRMLRAVRQRRVFPLAWTPMNCARRLEYPIDLLIMAKAVHPGLFADLPAHEWVLRFYQRTYRIGEEQAFGLRRAQWLEWTADADF